MFYITGPYLGVFMKSESSRASEVLKSTRIMATLKRTEPLIKQKGIIVYPAAVRRSVAIVEVHRHSGKFRIRRLVRPCLRMSDGFLVLRKLPSRLFSSSGKVQPHRYSTRVSFRSDYRYRDTARNVLSEGILGRRRR